MNVFRKAWNQKSLLALLCLAILLLDRCAPSGSPDADSPACTPNVIDSNMSMMVTPLGGNVYSFQLCANATNPNGAYSVYGGVDKDSVAQNNFNVQAASRSVHISQANTAGAIFQVTFLNSDLYFAVYEDQVGATSLLLDGSSTPLMRPHRLPGR